MGGCFAIDTFSGVLLHSFAISHCAPFNDLQDLPATHWLILIYQNTDYDDQWWYWLPIIRGSEEGAGNKSRNWILEKSNLLAENTIAGQQLKSFLTIYDHLWAFLTRPWSYLDWHTIPSDSSFDDLFVNFMIYISTEILCVQPLNSAHFVKFKKKKLLPILCAVPNTHPRKFSPAPHSAVPELLRLPYIGHSISPLRQAHWETSSSILSRIFLTSFSSS